MLKIETSKSAGLIELTVDGAIHKPDYEAAVAAIDELLKTHDKLNVIEVVHKIGWVDADVWWKDLTFHLTHRNFIHRAAVVSDSGWIGPVTRFLAPLYPAEIRTFGMDQLEQARKWAKLGNVARAAV
jgi:hypothetical protein